jgi:hypothetical protein
MLRIKTNEGKTSINIGGGNWIYTIFAFCTALIGYHIHSSVFWSIMDFFFAPFAWIKWLIYQEVTLTVIKETFSWFFQ